MAATVARNKPIAVRRALLNFAAFARSSPSVLVRCTMQVQQQLRAGSLTDGIFSICHSFTNPDT
jgi:hypothetical protein